MTRDIISFDMYLYRIDMTDFQIFLQKKKKKFDSKIDSSNLGQFHGYLDKIWYSLLHSRQRSHEVRITLE